MAGKRKKYSAGGRDDDGKRTSVNVSVNARTNRKNTAKEGSGKGGRYVATKRSVKEPKQFAKMVMKEDRTNKPKFNNPIKQARKYFNNKYTEGE